MMSNDPASTPLSTYSPHEGTLPKSQLDFPPDIKATPDKECDQENKKLDLSLPKEHRDREKIEEQNKHWHACSTHYPSEYLSHT
jgi:hypothetical protein